METKIASDVVTWIEYAEAPGGPYSVTVSNRGSPRSMPAFEILVGECWGAFLRTLGGLWRERNKPLSPPREKNYAVTVLGKCGSQLRFVAHWRRV